MNADLTGIVFEIDTEIGQPIAEVSGVSQNINPVPASRVSKSGIVSHSSFSGTPKKASVVFAVAFSNTNYALCISGQDSRVFTYDSKTQNGFTINANANGALTGEVSWIAIPVGET